MDQLTKVGFSPSESKGGSGSLADRRWDETLPDKTRDRVFRGTNGDGIVGPPTGEPRGEALLDRCCEERREEWRDLFGDGCGPWRASNSDCLCSAVNPSTRAATSRGCLGAAWESSNWRCSCSICVLASSSSCSTVLVAGARAMRLPLALLLGPAVGSIWEASDIAIGRRLICRRVVNEVGRACNAVFEKIPSSWKGVFLFWGGWFC